MEKQYSVEKSSAKSFKWINLVPVWKKTEWVNEKSEWRNLWVKFIADYFLKSKISYPFTGWTARHWGLSIPWMIEVFKEPSKCATLICVSSNSELIQYKFRDIQSTARPLILWISAKIDSNTIDIFFLDYSQSLRKRNYLSYFVLNQMCGIF